MYQKLRVPSGQKPFERWIAYIHVSELFGEAAQQNVFNVTLTLVHQLTFESCLAYVGECVCVFNGGGCDSCIRV